MKKFKGEWRTSASGFLKTHFNKVCLVVSFSPSCKKTLKWVTRFVPSVGDVEWNVFSVWIWSSWVKEFFHPRKPSNPQPGPSPQAEIPEQKAANLFQSNTLRRHHQIPKGEGESEWTSFRSKPSETRKGGLNWWRFPWPRGLVGDIRASPFPDLRPRGTEHRGKTTEPPSVDPSPTKRDFRSPACSGKWPWPGNTCKVSVSTGKRHCRAERWGVCTHTYIPETSCHPVTTAL